MGDARRFATASKFGEGVVGADVQRGLRVGLGGPGQKQDGRGAGLAQRADYLDHAGQAEIQDDQVGVLVPASSSAVSALSASATW
jgi:hypothetical protein